MRTLSKSTAGLLIAAVTWIAPTATLAQEITQDDVIAGTMDIDFGTRTTLDTTGDLKDGSPAIGAKDKYKFTLRVATTTEYSGEIKRSPNLYSSVMQKRKQEAAIEYAVDLALYNPNDLKQKKVVGKWVGLVPIDTATGAFDLAGGASKERPLRIQVDAVGKAAAFTDNFTGRLIGKAETKSNLAQYTFKRLVGNKTVEVVVKQSDPMRFENMVLAKGPTETYPRTVVSGRFDYDYETGNWLTDGIRLRYQLDGKEFEDIITGTVKWVEDPDRETNGKGYYEFNLRFNEEKNRSASGEGAAFEKLSDEEAFFAVDNSIPCLTGKISYVDTFKSGSDTPIASKVTYNLNANKLSKQQVVAFFKLWMMGIGPINDE